MINSEFSTQQLQPINLPHMTNLSTLSKYTFHSIKKINKRYRSANMATDEAWVARKERIHMELVEVSEALVGFKQ